MIERVLPGGFGRLTLDDPLERGFYEKQPIAEHGVPAFIRTDNGPEFVSLAILECLRENRIETAHIDPGKP